MVGIRGQAIDAYGVAFQILFDPEVSTMEAGAFKDQVGADDGSTTWDIEFTDSVTSTLDVAITRTNGLSLEGLGAITTFKTSFTGAEKPESKGVSMEPFLKAKSIFKRCFQTCISYS